MNVTIKKKHLQLFADETSCKSSIILSKLESGYRGDDQELVVALEELAAKDLASFHAWMAIAYKEERELLGCWKKTNLFVGLRRDPKGHKVKTLESLVAALRSYIGTSEHKWLFTEASDGSVIPYFVSSAEYKSGRREEPACTSMNLEAYVRGSNESKAVFWHGSDLKKSDNVVELLASKGYFLETPDAVAKYAEEVEQLKACQGKLGEQFLAVGEALANGRGWWKDSDISMERDGRPTRVLIDDESSDEEAARQNRRADDGIASMTFWETGKESSGDEDVESVALPIHPYVQVFDLEKHQFLIIHVRNLSPYDYDSEIFSKLVLPDDVKDLVHILVEGSNDRMDDIVRGKTGGTIIIATGPPGTGKTLTAEVFSEAVKRPLYVVQCSQLGTNEEALEKHLRAVLDRAARWKAILLIDEADVYIHERGSDVQQNAMVGVFLRVLEYYRGILFMTSNRATIIDDAIMSRATAWIQYELPTPIEAQKIWEILAKQFGLVFEDRFYKDLLSKQPFGRLSGRNIKNLLKLAARLAGSNKTKLGLDVVQRASKFLDLRAAKDVQP
jgi:hypothetical protein